MFILLFHLQMARQKNSVENSRAKSMEERTKSLDTRQTQISEKSHKMEHSIGESHAMYSSAICLQKDRLRSNSYCIALRESIYINLENLRTNSSSNLKYSHLEEGNKSSLVETNKAHRKSVSSV